MLVGVPTAVVKIPRQRRPNSPAAGPEAISRSFNPNAVALFKQTKRQSSTSGAARCEFNGNPGRQADFGSDRRDRVAAKAAAAATGAEHYAGR